MLRKNKDFENTFVSFYKGIWTITKSHHKIAGFIWETSSIIRLFGSLDIYYNNSLNADLQKQDETQVKKFEAKGVDSMIFGIQCKTFFQET